MQKVGVSFRATSKMVKQLDALAKRQRRPRTQLIDEALENYLEIQRWQMREIENSLREADAADFATEEQVRRVYERLTR